MKTLLTGLYVGRTRPMPGDGRPTAIFKKPVAGAVQVGELGIVGDEQADRRVHGGPEKALHHFPAETLRALATDFPQAAATLVPGGIGENFSTEGWTEANVCLGDVYALGTVRVQLCQPRSPCWKIDARHGTDGMTRHIAAHGIAGWYYRVLQGGRVQLGDEFELIERAPAPVTLAGFWSTVHAHRPAPEDLRAIAAAPGLAEGWRERIAQRIDWLRNQAKGTPDSGA